MRRERYFRGIHNLSEESLELDEGEQVTLKVIIMPEDATNKTVLWSSDNNDVASVSMICAPKVGHKNFWDEKERELP